MMHRQQSSCTLKTTGKSTQFILHGEPFLILAAELQNSSMSSAGFMKSVWPKLAADHINTVLGSVYWEQIEPSEGRFNFSELKDCILDARKAGLHLILLWFGSFKNGLSTYVPGWIKTDTRRFPRAQLREAGGRRVTADILSLFESDLEVVEKRTFSALMQFLYNLDAGSGTVIMVQVENEVGILGDSRDGNDAATRLYNSPVPMDFREFLSRNWDKLHPTLKSNIGHCREKVQQSDSTLTWPLLFGDTKRTDELFMAYYYANYVGNVAASGKSMYNLPMYTNVWQNYGAEDRDTSLPAIVGGGSDPGIYPSGGGVINVLDIWHHFAEALNFIAPDIYLNDYGSSCAKYRHQDQPLFIPEQRRDEYGARRIWQAYGSFQALGTSPFGIDTTEVEHGHNPFAKHYALLSQCSYYILYTQKHPGSSVGFYFDDLPSDGVAGAEDLENLTFAFGEWNLLVQRSFVFGQPAAGYGMIIQLEPSKPRFLLIGRGFQLTFTSIHEAAHFSGILSFQEKRIIDRAKGKLETVRWLNGDETRSGKFAIMPSENPDYGGFPISITVPSGTGIAEVEAYALYHDQ